MNTFYIFSAIWVFVAICTFIYLFYESAPYGRHIKNGWGIDIPARLGWIVMESPCVILMIVFSIIVKEQLETIHQIFLLLWLTHYVHRSFISVSYTHLTLPTILLV